MSMIAHSAEKAVENYINTVYGTKMIKDLEDIVTDQIEISFKEGTFIHGKQDFSKRTREYWERYSTLDVIYKTPVRGEMESDGKLYVNLQLNLTRNDDTHLHKAGWWVFTFFMPR